MALGLALGVDTPLGFGFFIMGAAPVAALVPAFAEAVEVNARSVLVLCLSGYAMALVLTPASVYLAAGTVVGFGVIATTLGAGLVVPSLLGRALHRWVARIPQGLRRAVVGACVFCITLGLGGGLVEGVRSAEVGLSGVALVVVVLAARTFGTGALARLLAPPGLKEEAPFAGGFKNVALAAAVAGTLSGPAAALPGLLALAFEVVYFVAIARSRSSRVSLEA
jgi:hypothetical protein